MLQISNRLGICIGILAMAGLSACHDDAGQKAEEPQKGIECGSVFCDPDTQACHNGACVSKDTACGDDFCDPETQECKDGACVAKDTPEPEKPECTVDSDCNDDAKECKAQKCVDKVPEEPEACPPGQERCDGECVSLDIDPRYCGSCDNKCVGIERCESGTCVKSCEGGLTECNDACVDLKTDRNNCGACGTTCKENERCGEVFDEASGENVVQCYSSECEGLTNCNGACVDLKSDRLNCNTCGHECGINEICDNGNCKLSCPSGQIECNGECISVQKDAENCGACGNKCDTDNGEICTNGFCASSCGDKVCGENSKCHDGECVCDGEGVVACTDGAEGKACVVPETSTKFCGCTAESAGMNCAALANTAESSCAEGSCVFTCAEGFADCDGNAANGCEANLADPATCGACDKACGGENGTPQCSAGECHIVCNDGFNECNGTCVNAETMQSDKQNCGFCGNSCGEGQECVAGFCNIKDCADDYVDYKITLLDGTEKTVKAYCLESKDQLIEFANAINQGKKYPESNEDNAYILTRAIAIDGANWQPIGTESKPFGGIFIGNGVKISTETAIPVTKNSGLFGYVSGAVLDGMNLELITKANGDGPNIGSLAGYVLNSKVDRSKSSGDIHGYNNFGGLLGFVSGSSVTNSSFSGKVTTEFHGFDEKHDNNNTGGFIGRIENSTVDNCSANVEVTHTRTTGWNTSGFIGYVVNSKILNSTATGSVKANWHAVTGFIGSTTSGTVVDKCHSNVKVTNCTTETLGNCVSGSFIAMASNTTVSNCTSTGDIIGGFLGGIVTSASGSTVIDNCKSSSNILSGNRVGGIVGMANAGVVIKNCEASGNIVKSVIAGGLVGTANEATITNSKATGAVFANRYSGGFVGNTSGTTIEDCVSTGKVTGNGSGALIGGFVGYSETAKFNRCIAESDVDASGDSIGGFVGFAGYQGNSSFTNCSAHGNVKGAKNTPNPDKTGGFAGNLNANATVENCYATGDVTGGDDYTGGFIGLVQQGEYAVYNTYSAGKVTGNGKESNKAGGYMGTAFSYSDNSHKPVTFYTDEGFWYAGACDTAPCNKGIHSGLDRIPKASYYAPYSFNENKEAEIEEDAKLVDELNGADSGWIEASCTLKSGPAEKVKIPVRKDLLPSFCTTEK